MAYIAQIQCTDPSLTVFDDRGIPATTLELRAQPSVPEDTDPHLTSSGWARTADWTTTDDGWQAPVVQDSHHA